MDPNQGCDPISCNRCSNHQVTALITAVTACNQGYMRADGAGRRADHAVFPPGIRSAAEIMEAYSGPVPLYKQVHTSPSTSRYTRLYKQVLKRMSAVAPRNAAAVVSCAAVVFFSAVGDISRDT